MKNCRSIRRELSAYLDGELAPPQRTEVEAHLTSCLRCQRELHEMKTLATGMAALPKLQPAPRFLIDVRRKIARDEHPEASSWQDYVFRPFWLKVPLEVAALIVIIGLVMREEHPVPTQKFAQLESARTENRENDRGRGAPSETAAETPRDSQTAPVAKAEPSPPQQMAEKDEKSVGAPQVADHAATADKKQLLDASLATGMPADGARRMPMVRSSDELSASPPSAPSPIVGVIRSMELAQSTLSETVTVHARDFEDVRNRAQQLAARCNGRVVAVPQSKDDPEQTLFVEMPQEYVAAFKLELLRSAGSSTALASGGRAAPSDSANGVVSGGVLTGNAATNNSVTTPGPFGLRDNATTAPKTVLEIRVVTPAN